MSCGKSPQWRTYITVCPRDGRRSQWWTTLWQGFLIQREVTSITNSIQSPIVSASQDLRICCHICLSDGATCLQSWNGISDYHNAFQGLEFPSFQNAFCATITWCRRCRVSMTLFTNVSSHPSTLLRLCCSQCISSYDRSVVVSSEAVHKGKILPQQQCAVNGFLLHPFFLCSTRGCAIVLSLRWDLFPNRGERFLRTFSALKQAVSDIMSCLVKIAIFKRLFQSVDVWSVS